MLWRELILAYHKDKKDKNDLRIKDQEKQWAYYSGNKYAIEDYLIKALEKTYDGREVKDMQLNWVNLTKPIVNQMAVVYREPATRRIFIKDKEEEGLTKYYNEKLPDDINTEDKTANRLGKLHNTSLTQVFFDILTGRYRYRVNSSYLYDVIENDDDPYKADEVRYAKYKKDAKGEDIQWTIVWTEKEHYYLDEHDDKKAIDGNNLLNPFKIIPFAITMIEKSDGFWGAGIDDVINVNEQVNLLLTKLVNRDIFIGTEGTLLSVNLGLNKKGKLEDGIQKVKTGLKNPISVDEARTDMHTPNLTHVSFNPQVATIREYIDWSITKICTLKGLNPNTILSIVKDTSDYQKIMDAVNQMELRRDDIEPMRIFEKHRFEITKRVNNYYATTKYKSQFGLQVIPEDAELRVDFAEIEIQKTPADIQTEREFEFKYGISTPVDWMKEDNPEADEKEIEAQILKNNGLKKKMEEPLKQVNPLLERFRNKMENQNAGQ